MKMSGVSTHLYHGERLARAHLAEIAGHGFDAVELFATRSHFDYHDPQSIEALAGWLAESKLIMPSVHAPIVDSLVNDQWGRAYSTATREEDARRATMGEMRAALEIARRLPFAYFVVHLGIPAAQNPGPHENSREAALRSIDEIYRVAEPLGVNVALEVMDNQLSTAPALIDLIENDLDGMNVGVCMDVGHAFMLGDVTDAIETVSGYLATTHIHDNRRERDDHLVPFEGAIDWAGAIMALEKIGYDGSSMFEIRNTSTPAEVLERAARARSRLEGLARSARLEAGSFS
jgi:sugar phosphate isomerase/epimerase